MIRLNTLAEIPRELPSQQPILKNSQGNNKTEEICKKVFFQQAEETSSDSEEEFYSIKMDILHTRERYLSQGCLFIASVQFLIIFDRLHDSENLVQNHKELKDLLKKENHLWIIEILANPLFAKYHVNKNHVVTIKEKAFRNILKCFNFNRENPKEFLISFHEKISVFKSYLDLSLKSGHDKEFLYYFFNEFFYQCLKSKDFASAGELLETLVVNFEKDLTSQELLGNIDMETLSEFFEGNKNFQMQQQVMWKFVLDQVEKGILGFAELIECLLFLKLGKFTEIVCKKAFEAIDFPPYFIEDLDEQPENYFFNLQDQLICFVMFLIEKKQWYLAEQLARFIQEEKTRIILENSIFYSLEEISHAVCDSLFED